MDDLVAKGWSPQSAAMAAGQAEAESGINPSGPAGDSGASVGMFQDQGSRRIALREFQAAHPEMTPEQSNIAFYDQEEQQQPWKHETSMARADEFGHATEGYGDASEGKRTRMSNAWLKVWEERQKEPAKPTAPAAQARSPIQNPLAGLRPIPPRALPHRPSDFVPDADAKDWADRHFPIGRPLDLGRQSSLNINDSRSVKHETNISVIGGSDAAQAAERSIDTADLLGHLQGNSA